MIGYIAKDEDGQLYLHRVEPTFDEELRGWFSECDMLCITNEFPEYDNLTWRDTPIKVELKLENV